MSTTGCMNAVLENVIMCFSLLKYIIVKCDLGIGGRHSQQYL